VKKDDKAEGQGLITLAPRILVAWVVMMIFASLMIVADLWQSRRDTQKTAADLLASETELAGRYVFERFAALEAMIGLLEAETEAVNNSPLNMPGLVHKEMRSFAGRDPTLAGLFVLGENGQMLAASWDDGPFEADFADQEYFTALKSLQSPAFHISGPLTEHYGVSNEKPLLVFSRPWKRRDRFMGAFVGLLDARALNAIIADVADHHQVKMTVLTRDSRVIAGSPPDVALLDRILSPCATSMSPFYTATPAHVEELEGRLVHCVEIPEYELVVLAALPLRVALEDWFIEVANKLLILSLLGGAAFFGTVLITGRRQARAAESRATLLAAAIEQSANAVIITDRNGVIEWANTALEMQTGYPLDEMIGNTPAKLKSGIQPPDFYAALWRTVLAGATWRGELLNRRKNGTLYRVRQVITPLLDTDGQPNRFIAIEEDVTEMVEAQAMLDRMKTTDMLTGLPNREGFLDGLDSIRLGAGRHLIAVIDIVQLHLINETAGRVIGDRLLLQLARWLDQNHAVLASARIGDDEFAFILTIDDQFQSASMHLDALTSALETELAHIEGCQAVRLRVGYALVGEDAANNRTLFANSEAALHVARARNSGRLTRYSAAISALAQRRRQLRQALAQALAGGEISFLVQPQVDLNTGQLTGGEILMRWTNQEFGAVSPVEFIPIAEESGAIIELGRAALKAALEVVCRPEFLAKPTLRLSLNASAVELSQPDYAEGLIAAVEAAGVEPKRLVIELTETAAGEATDTLKRQLQTLLDRGFGIEIDDFGTGYATLSHLRNLPLNGIKIDREFIAPLLEDRTAMLIVQGVIALAGSLGAHVVAEGVETKEHAGRLAEMGCQFGQGYFFAAPLSVEKFLAWREQA